MRDEDEDEEEGDEGPRGLPSPNKRQGYIMFKTSNASGVKNSERTSLAFLAAPSSNYYRKRGRYNSEGPRRER